MLTYRLDEWQDHESTMGRLLLSRTVVQERSPQLRRRHGLIMDEVE
jgi:hypothetical protein